MLRFKDLEVGDRFVFASENDWNFRFTGFERGPWIKTGIRTYYKPSMIKQQADVAKTYRLKLAKFQQCHVGTISAKIEKIEGGLTSEEISAELKKFDYYKQ